MPACLHISTRANVCQEDNAVKMAFFAVRTGYWEGRDGDIYLRPSDGTSPILVNKTVTDTLRAGLEIIEERTEVRTGIVIDMVLTRHWLRLQTSHNDRAEEWTLTFTKDLDRDMYDQKLPRRARVVFSTRTPQKLTSGKGHILEFNNLPDDSEQS